MPCGRPNIRIFGAKKNGEDFFSSLERYIKYGMSNKPNTAPADDMTTQRRREREVKAKIKTGEIVICPCKHCQGCILDRRKSWANRMEMELPYHDQAWFLTLTYDNKHVPINIERGKGIDKNGVLQAPSGEYTTNLTLDYDDLTAFWKRLRRWTEYHERMYQVYDEKVGMKNKLMYYASGEYGTKTHRPHYHAIVYSLYIDPKELKVYKKQKGRVYYTCEWLNQIWGKGFVIIGVAEWNDMAYTAAYCSKKAYGEAKEKFLDMCIEEEDSRISTKPSIGWRYYEDHKDEIYQKDSIQLSKGKRCKPPAYFDKLFDLEHSNSKPLNAETEKDYEALIIKAESDELKEIKRRRRKIANDALFAQLAQHGYSLQEHYNNIDAKNQEKFSKLRRDEI